MKEFLLTIAIRFVPELFLIPLLFLLWKENKIAKGLRSDFRESDQIWMILLAIAPAVCIVILLLLLNMADTLGEFLKYGFFVWLKNGTMPAAAGIGALALHAQNRKTLAQENAAQLQEQMRRRSDKVQKKLMAAVAVLAVVGVAIALVWRFCFPEKLSWLAIAYFVYINLGAFWIVKITRAKDEEE